MTDFSLSTVRETVSIFDKGGYPLGEATWLTSTSTVDIQMFDLPCPISVTLNSSLVETVNDFLISRVADRRKT